MAMSVYDRIRDAIVDGTIRPGQVLSENRLAAEYGASRTPVREALHRLEIEELVERLPRGVRVRETSPDEIIDIYDVRITLEGAAAGAAAHRATALGLRRIRAAHEAMQVARVDAQGRAQMNRQFHEAIWSASHSPTLVDLLRRLNIHLIRYPTTTLEGDARWAAALEEHDLILRAIEDRDSVRAREVAERHMAAAREVRMQMYTGLS